MSEKTPDQAAQEAAEKHEQGIRDKAQIIGEHAIASWRPADSFLAGASWQSSRPPPPEGGAEVPPRVWVHIDSSTNPKATFFVAKFEQFDRSYAHAREYLSLTEHEQILQRERQKARAEAFEEVLAAAKRIYEEDLESNPSDYFRTKRAVEEARYNDPHPGSGDGAGGGT